MISKIPIIGSSLTFTDFCCAFKRGSDAKTESELADTLSEFCSGKEIFLLDSGAACLEVILSCLKEQNAKDEVIMPAYAPGILVDIVLKAGLKPVLCDVSFNTFNCDYDSLLRCISKKTLLVLVVHMFGMIMEGIEKLRLDLPRDIYIVEDCAQAMGSSVHNKKTGSFSETGFFSFGRGKNISLCAGGFIATRDKRLVESIKKYIDCLKPPKFIDQLSWLVKALLVSYVVKPGVYGFMHNFTESFKKVKQDKLSFRSKFSPFQSRLACRLLSRKESIFLNRHANGMFLLKRLKGIQELICPVVSELSRPAFNRLPFILRDPGKVSLIKKRLWDAGIESSDLYGQPLHHKFDLGYKTQEFPNACFLADGLLTLPVYPEVKMYYLIKALEVIKKDVV